MLHFRFAFLSFTDLGKLVSNRGLFGTVLLGSILPDAVLFGTDSLGTDLLGLFYPALPC